MPTTHLFTGLQLFWTYDSFNVNTKGFGNGIGRINVAGGKLVDAGENSFSLPTDFNFSFQVFELALKFHQNSPYLMRFWNSTEIDQTTYFNDHFGLFGKWWISNFEHCLIEDTGNYRITEIGPSGERNVYTESGGNYTAPAGVLKDMTKSSGEFDLMTHGYYTFHFKHLTNDESNLYRLDYLKDKNNVRIYVVWESVDSKYRINNIAVSTDSGTTKTNVLSFKYVTFQIDSTTYHFVSEITDNAHRVWSYTYDTDNNGLLVRAHYPSAIDVEYVYNTSGGSPTYNLEEIVDPRKHAWIIDYTNKLWKIEVGGEWHYTYYDWYIDTATGVVNCTKRDPRSSSSSDDNYRTVYTTNTTGSIRGNQVSRKTTDTTSTTWIEWQFEWTNNFVTKVTEPNAVDSSEHNYTTYSYNSDGLLEYTMKYMQDVEQTRLRLKNSFNAGSDKYELASVEMDFSDGTYYCSKTEYTYDTSHRMIKSVSGINPDPNATCDPEECSLYITVSYEYDNYGNAIRIVDPEGNASTFQYDSLGAVLQTIDPNGSMTQLVYDPLSLNVVSQTNSLGVVSTTVINDALLRIGAIDPLGNRYSQTFDPSGNLVSYSGPSGTASMHYDEKNRLTDETQQNGLTTYYTYFKNDIMSSKRYYLAEDDTSTAVEYEQSYLCHNSGRVYRYTDAEGQYIQFTFDKTGNMLTLVDRNSATSWTKTYDFANRITGVGFPRTDGYEGSASYEYNGYFGNMSKDTRTSNYSGNDTNQETTFSYDRAGRLYKTTYPQYIYRGTTYTFTVFNYYDQTGRVVKVIKRKNDGQDDFDNYVINEYDNLGRIITIRKQAQTDSQGEVNNEIITSYGYDAVGNRTSVSINGIVTATISYDSIGRPVETTSASGEKTLKVYSGSSGGSCGSGKIQVIKGSQNASGALGNQMLTVGVASVEPSKTSTMVYESNGRTVSTIDASGLAITREHMANGWLKRTTWSNGDYTTYYYNKTGDVTRVEEVAPDSDGENYIVRTTLEIRYGYGPYTATTGTGFPGESGYNRWEEYVTKKSDTPHYYATVYFYDVMDRLTEVWFLDADDTTKRSIHYLYDGFGNVIERTKADSTVIDYKYDGRNRMTRAEFDANNYNDYEYSCCGMLERHQQTVAGSQLDPFELTYDKATRLTKEQYPDSGNPKTQFFTYSYDNANRRTKWTDPTYGPDNGQASDRPMRYKYDANSRLAVIGREEDNSYHRNTAEDYRIIYDDQGRMTKMVYPGDNNAPAMEVEYRYTVGSWIDKIIARDIKSMPSVDIYCIEYHYDARGRICTETVKDKESDTDKSAHYIINYRYDSRDMLVEEKYQRWNDGNSCWDVLYCAQYKYDTAGNIVLRRISQMVSGTTKTYEDASFVYSRGYHLKQFTRTAILTGGNENHNVAFTYDANGNCTHILQSGSFTDNNFYGVTEMEFQYNADDKLIEFRYDGSGNWNEIQYDAIGRVIERIDTSSVSSKYYYDNHQLVQQLDSSNEVDFDYFAGPLGLMRQIDETGAGDEKRLYILDGKRTVKALVDPSDLSIKRYNYNSFGEHLEKDSAFPSESNVIRYIGNRLEGFAKSLDAKGALYHLGHRHYLAQLGLFLQRDPLYTAISPKAYYVKDINPYGYSGNNPVMKVDRHGLTSCFDDINSFWSGCSDPATNISMSTGWKHGSQYNSGSCECDRYSYIGITHFGDLHFYGWKNGGVDYHNVKDIPLIYLAGLCSVVQNNAVLDITMSGTLCCEVLRLCKICTQQRVFDDWELINAGLPWVIGGSFIYNIGCMCTCMDWVKPHHPWQAGACSIMCLGGHIDWKADCDCNFFSAAIDKYMRTLAGKPGGTRCWGWCQTEWHRNHYPWPYPSWHHWITIWPVQFLRTMEVADLDAWGFGKNVLTRSQHEAYYPILVNSPHFSPCWSGGGESVYTGFNPEY
jgi:RHS repeat-associated protein